MGVIFCGNFILVLEVYSKTRIQWRFWDPQSQRKKMEMDGIFGEKKDGTSPLDFMDDTSAKSNHFLIKNSNSNSNTNT